MNELPERFWDKIEYDTNGGCWFWSGALSQGYGKFYHGEKVVQAHRLAYEAFVGPVPSGLQIDHLCRVRACVNPNHLEPVTSYENLHRSPLFPRNAVACKNGHKYTSKTVYMSLKPTGYVVRKCRVCDRLRHARYRAST